MTPRCFLIYSSYISKNVIKLSTMDGEIFEMYSSQMPKTGYRIFRKLISRIALQLISRVFEEHFEFSRGGGYIPGDSRVNSRVLGFKVATLNYFKK